MQLKVQNEIYNNSQQFFLSDENVQMNLEIIK